MNWLLALALLQVPTGPSVAIANVTAIQQDSYASHVFGTPLKTNGNPGTWNYTFTLPAGWSCEPFTGPDFGGVKCYSYPMPHGVTSGPVYFPSGAEGAPRYGKITTDGSDLNGNPTYVDFTFAQLAVTPVAARVK